MIAPIDSLESIGDPPPPPSPPPPPLLGAS